MSKADSALIARLQRDDVSAFDALYWKYHQAVYRNIIKFTKDAIVAEDILQEVFTKLWEKRHDLDAEQSVAGWVFVISFNISINHTRKKLREQTSQKKLMLADSIYDDAVLSVHQQEEQHLLLEQAIEQLSPQKKKIVTLCKLEGKTYEEAACELKISRHTVKEHLSAAMVNLNDYVRKNPVFTHITLLLIWLNL